MTISAIAGTALGALLWVQANTVSAMDFARHQNVSDQSLILLQITDRRNELYRVKQNPNPSDYEMNTIEELQQELELLRDNLTELQKRKY